jgi:hypothetical protein
MVSAIWPAPQVMITPVWLAPLSVMPFLPLGMLTCPL